MGNKRVRRLVNGRVMETRERERERGRWVAASMGEEEGLFPFYIYPKF